MIKIPKLFQEKLANSDELRAAVSNSFIQFEPWLDSSGTPFFPGFTDHSPRHISDVLDTAASLISDESQKLITAEDVAVLCIAILLHDCAMHLTRDGFRALIEDSGQPIVSGFGDKPWPQLWRDFTAEAGRFGQDKLLAIFGDSEPLLTGEIDYDNLSERDDLLIGEFVRRHHTRLAHEIAIKGVPSRSKEKLELIGFDADLKDIAGLIARSHGMSIRNTFSYLEERYDLIHEQRKVKGPYLMAVLRIADYVQVQSERAIRSLLSIKELRSPISRQEWRNHFAVKDISYYNDDPEAFFVNTEPKDVKTYLRLVGLFKDIQRELDESWATIGEIYGRRGKLASLGLTMRRIRSSLDSAEKFAKRVPYIPIEAGFNSSGPDLLKLLVGPLYDYKPAVGVRELIQNAVDACKELSDLASHQSSINTQSHQEPDIILSIHENNDGAGWITITDKGVGMTLDTITKYFLIAGASFRNSDLWKRQHTDESGQTRVMRGGRFGVGALASFLLGEEIEVTTRAFDRPETEGIEFKARIDEPIIELRRCVAPVGTSVKIWVSDSKVFDAFRPYQLRDNKDRDSEILLDSWPEVDWFVQTEPRIEYRWNGFNWTMRANISSGSRFRVSATFSPKVNKLIPFQGTSTSSWQRLSDPGPYKDIYWRYTPEEKQNNGGSTWKHYPNDEATVNGIRVEEITNYGRPSSLYLSDNYFNKGPTYSIKRPSMAIFDPSGICPINLQRSAISFDRMGMDLSMAKAILGVHLRNIIKNAGSSGTIAGFYKLCVELVECRDVRYQGIVSRVCATSDGIFLAAPNVLTGLEVKTLYFVNALEPQLMDPITVANILDDDEALIFRIAPSGVQNDLSWFRGVLCGGNISEYGYASSAGFPRVSSIASTLIMPSEKWSFANKKGRISKDILNTLTSQQLENGDIAATNGNNTKANHMLSRCQSISKIMGENLEIGAWSLSSDQAHGYESSLIVDTWLEINNNSLIINFD
ncbi:HD domain-containing protein [Methylobacter svalbardensis]|uniref:HD domain-containing protein n=1 Tax=Methylobacter svalbardensis TaxID=3080016 RepID=UPI0030EBD64E